jgi:hypothetical protein
MTAEQVLQLHSEGFNRALTRQDYDALEEIYSETYICWFGPTAPC